MKIYKYHNHRIILSALLMMIMLYACGPTLVSHEELEAYMYDESHGLIQEVKRGDVLVKVAYKPNDLLVAQSLFNKEEVTGDEVDRLRKNYGDFAYFVLSLSRDQKEVVDPRRGLPQFSEQLNKLAYRMYDYARLTTSQGDTIPVADFVYPRLYGMSQATTLLVAFSNEQLLTSENIQFHLDELGLGTGSLHFSFRKKDIENVPAMNFDIEQAAQLFNENHKTINR